MQIFVCLAVVLAIAGIQVADAAGVCRPGTYSSTGRLPCEDCPVGHSAGGSNNRACDACRTGWVQPRTGQDKCIKCEPGSYQDSTGQLECILCSPGYYQPGHAQDSCRPCPRQKYAPNPGMRQCIRCPQGQTTTITGATSAAACVNTNGIGGEPHILISNSGHNLCFNFHGMNDEVFDLISDDENEIYVTGETFEIQVPTKLHLFSYFLAVSIQTPDHTLHFGREDYTVDGRTYSYEEEVHMDDLTVEPAAVANDYQVDLSNGATFLVTKRSNDIVGVYMGVHAVGTDGLSSSSRGIIGQFLHTHFRPEINEDGTSATMIFDDDHASVPVQKTTRLSRATGDSVECWFYHETPDNLIGDHDDYLVEEV